MNHPTKNSLIKRKVKGLMSKMNLDIEIRSEKWILQQAEAYEKQAKRKPPVEITSDLAERKAYTHISRSIECAIDSLMKQRRSFRNMLVIRNPYQYSPLCAIALFHTKEACSVRVTVKGRTKDCDVSYCLPKEKEHKVPVMGLYPDFENTIVLELLDSSGLAKQEKTFRLTTSPLKGKNANIKITKELSKSEYLYPLTLVYGGGDDGIFPYAFDRNGDIRFCFSMAPKTYGFQPISGGKFLFLNKKVVRLTATNPASTELEIVDQMGRFHKLYHVEKGAHHDFAETKSGNLVVGSNAVDGGTFEDTVIEIDRSTGEVVNEVRIRDYVDTRFVDTADWAHLNTIQYAEDEKTVVVCLRNLHTVMKINYEKKQVEWVLANPEFWKGSPLEDKVLTPVGEHMEWFFQAHASYILDADLDGNPETKHLIIYDNHTQKRRPVTYYDNSKFSYVRIYTLNEKEKTVSLFKSYPLKRSSIRSNAVFEEAAGRIMAMSGKIKKENGKFKGEIAEIDYKTGETCNRYSVNHGYYRSYEFRFEPQEMQKPVESGSDYILGRIYQTKEVEKPDIEKAEELPEPVLAECYASETERTKRLAELAKTNPEYEEDPKQDMARIMMETQDETLYITLTDHLLEGIYFVGNEHTYLRDFTETKQERPEYFGRVSTTDAVCMNDFAAGVYEIYFKHRIGLYKSGHSIEIK